MKFGQFKECNVRNIFSWKIMQKRRRKTSPPASFLTALYEENVGTLILVYVDRPRLRHTIKTDCTKFQTVDLKICSILIFEKKGLRLVSPPYFACDFSRKIFLMLYSINWPNFIVYFPLLHEILGNMLIVIICFPGYDNAKNFEINFFNVFKGLSVARKCLRPESGSLIIKRKKRQQ